MAGQLEMFRVKYEEAVEARKKAEMDIEAFRPVRPRLSAYFIYISVHFCLYIHICSSNKHTTSQVHECMECAYA